MLGHVFRPRRSTPTSPAATRAELSSPQKPTAKSTSKLSGNVKELKQALHLPGRNRKRFDNTVLVPSTTSNHPHSLLNTPHQHLALDGFSAAAERASLAVQPTSSPRLSVSSAPASSTSLPSTDCILDEAPRKICKPIPSFQPPSPPSPPTALVSPSSENLPPTSWMLDASPPRIRKPIPQSWLEGEHVPSAEQIDEHPAMEANLQPGGVSEDNPIGTDGVTFAPPTSSIQQSSSANVALQHPSHLIVHGLENTHSSQGNPVNNPGTDPMLVVCT
ncbi:hypothetical protein FRC01_002882 [Tulasnella sp. 417]|nr:hypothetical protein FRC01_002882 [Tulasnella sp. 417]